MARQQRRGRRIAMSPEELDEFLRTERTCRVATMAADRGPHVSALWFAWDGRALWLTSIVRSQRWTDIERDPRVSVLVDAGVGYEELRGAELIGRIEQVGEVPRKGEPNAELEEPERLFAEKYTGQSQMGHDGRHAWLKLVPEKIVTWDFRKLATLGR